MANNANINKVIYGNDTLIDLTSDTVTQADVLNSKSFHDASGTLRTGTADISGKADLTDLADAFSESTAYSTGDYVTYDGDLYRFTSNKSAGAWDSTRATQITVADELSVLPSKADKTQLAPAFSTSSSYSAGSYCTFNGKLYRFDDSKSAGDWSYSKVTEVTVGGELRQKENWTSFSSGDFLVVDLAVEHQLPQHNVTLLRADSVAGGGSGVVSADQVSTALNKTANPEMIAPTFSSSQAYSAGDYVTKLDGVIGAKVKLFQFTANHTGSWTGLDATEVEVTTVLNNKVDKVSGKGLSTNDYDNTAKGIVDNIQDNVKANTQLISESIWGESGKNMLPITATTQTINGVTFTMNNDGSITLNNTATANADININTDLELKAGQKLLFNFASQDTEDVRLTIYQYIGGTTANTVNCFGKDTEYTVQTTGRHVVYIRAFSGKTYNNLTIYPMVRDADILDDTFEPYHSSVKDTLRDAEVIEGKNYIKPTSRGDSIFSVDANGVATANGTASGATDWFCYSDGGVILKAGKYIVNGLPSTGSGNTFDMFIRKHGQSAGTDFFNNETEITIAEDGVYDFFLTIRSGYTANNLVFKPMIRLATETDPSYEPYYVPLKDSMFLREEQRVLGAKNFLKNIRKSHEQFGITWSVDDNGIITANGTNTDNSYFQLYCDTSNDNCDYQTILDTKSTYILSGNSQKWSDEWYMCLFLRVNHGNNTNTYFFDNGYGVTIDLSQFSDINFIRLYCRVGYSHGAQTLTNYKFYPMLRLATDPDDTYVPYAMTNKELTDKAYNTSDTAETTIADADYFPFYDTSATGKRKTLWSTIKSVLKTYFDSLYNNYLENSSVTLSTSQTTTVTFSDARITTSSLIDFYCTQWDLVPDDITVSTGSCVITLPQVDTAVTVNVRIYIK